MIKNRRQQRILEILACERAIEISELARVMPEVSRVTLRRDISELADAGALKRTHGGAVLPDATILKHPASETPREIAGVDALDAVILPPVHGRGGDALRRYIGRRGIPFLAESAPQPGGVYLGPNNFAAGAELGRLAAKDAAGQSHARVLIVGQPDLANTRARVEGFLAGLRAVLDGVIETTTINGQGSYKVALRVAMDAFASAAEPFDMVFAVNDHAAVAAAEAAAQHSARVKLYATGGENPDFVAEVASDGPLRAVAAFFPEVVGVMAIDRIAAALNQPSAPDGTETPHAIITAETLEDYFEQGADGWRLRPKRRDQMVGTPAAVGVWSRRARVGFMPHFPAHDWYRAMTQAMQARASELKLEVVVTPPHQGIAAEMSRLRGEIAVHAAETLSAGETIVLGEGEATLCLAVEIRRLAFADAARLAGLTVLTNSLDVLYRLEGAPSIKTILTSGEYQAADRCLVGPSVGAVFDRIRADRAFLSVAGVSHRFGASALDERRALAASRIVGAARQTIALADHTLIGAEANHLIIRIEDLDAVITDDGTMPADRQSLRAAGVEVLVAEDHAEKGAARTVLRRHAREGTG